MAKAARLKKELEQLEVSPPPGASCWIVQDTIDSLEGIILGPTGSPFQGGSFKFKINIPDRYPFEPPKVEFVTPVYHPNIDGQGRICLDILKMPPAGDWRPSINLYSVLTSLQLLLSEPNPRDPLMADIARQYQFDTQKYEETARNWTHKYAVSEGKGNVSKLANKRKSDGEQSNAMDIKKNKL